MDLIKRSTTNDFLWYFENNSDQVSFVGLLQLYSDKSRKCLKESAFQFYRIHAMFLNFSEAYRRSCILSGLTTVALLPTTFYVIEDQNHIEKGVSRMQKLCMLHLCLSGIFEEIGIFGLQGFLFLDKEQNKRVFHPVISSYCCDLPEATDLASVKNGNNSNRNCHRCMAPTKSFNLYTKAELTKGTKSVSLISRARDMRSAQQNKDAESLLQHHPLMEQVSFLYNFSFTDAHRIFDIHSIFTSDHCITITLEFRRN